jgi:hypothetical protein
VISLSLSLSLREHGECISAYCWTNNYRSVCIGCHTYQQLSFFPFTCHVNMAIIGSEIGCALEAFFMHCSSFISDISDSVNRYKFCTAHLDGICNFLFLVFFFSNCNLSEHCIVGSFLN